MEVEKTGIEESSAHILYLLDNLEEKIEESHFNFNLPSPSIDEIPATISSMIPASPYRHYVQLGLVEKQDMVASDEVKVKEMHSLFEHLASPRHEIATLCVNKVYDKTNEIMACYGRDIYKYSNESRGSIPWRMVMDACYILELIRKWSVYDKSNPFHRSLVSLEEKHDLVRLDNQIPFFVLQDIFECTLFKLMDATTMGTPSLLPKLILAFLKDIIPFEPNIAIPDHDDYKHILDLVYQCYYDPQHSPLSYQLSRVTAMLSATELAKAGVKFIPNQGGEYWKLDMNFRSSWGNATLTIPTIRIDESTTPILCNLAAYEHCFPYVGNYIASYVFVMKMLLDTKEDVLKLVESNICRNPSGHQYIVDLFRGLCKDVVLTNFFYATQWEEMGKYCDSWLGWTRRTYFSGAWSYIASISALILFFLTAIQTYCSIRTL